MSGGGFRVDPDQLAGAGSAIGAVAQQLATALQGLQATVTSGNPWGADEPGTVFGAAYGEVLGRALEAYGSHVEQLGGAADRLLSWAGTVNDTDQAQAATFDRLAGTQG